MKTIMQGTVCATITPFASDGKLDEDSLRSFCRYLATTKLNCVYPLGTNGEGMAMSLAEKRRVIDIYVEELGGKKPISIQCGGITLADTMDTLLYARDRGADAAGVVTPYFFRQSGEALYRYYSALAEAAGDFALYIYNIPNNSNDDISADTVRRLAQNHPNIVGIKYSFPDLLRIQDYLTSRDGFSVLIGCDRLYQATLALGATGTVSGPSVMYHELFNQVYTCMRQNDWQGALDAQRRIAEQDRRLSRWQGIPVLKVFLQKSGVIASDTCRVPFEPIEREQQEQVYSIISQYR